MAKSSCGGFANPTPTTYHNEIENKKLLQEEEEEEEEGMVRK